MKANPVRDVRRLRYVTEGFHTWTVEEVRRFEERHAIGTKARLALALLLYLGIRRGDVVRLWQYIKMGLPSRPPVRRSTRACRSRINRSWRISQVVAATPAGK